MTEQPKWVVDTNLLISRLLVPRGVAAQAVDHALSRGVLLVSDATLAELVDVLWRPKFDRYLTREDRERFVALLAGVTEPVDDVPGGGAVTVGGLSGYRTPPGPITFLPVT